MAKKDNPIQAVNKRLLFLYIFIIAVFLILIVRLFFMQVVNGAEYAESAANNIDRVVNIEARRGVIYDANGNVLASSEPFMGVNVYLNEVDDKEALAENLAELFNREDIYTAEEEARKIIGVSSINEAIEDNALKLEEEKRKEAEANGEEVEAEEDTETSDSSDDSTAEATEADEDNEDETEGTLSKNQLTTADEVLELMTSSGRNYEPISIRSYTYDVGVKVAQIIAENKDKYKGVTVEEEAMRTYPNGYILGQVLGTVGVISEGQLEEEGEIYSYKLNDIVGKSGLESYYEHYTIEGKEMGLRGQDGKRYLEVDARGNITNVISEEQPVSGNSLKLTIDLNTQEFMERSLKEVVASAGNSKCKAGSAVMVNVKTGGVVAMASYPSIDPNDFVRGLTADEVDYYFSDELKPQINRAISGGYASGSTFKLVCATALLFAGVPVTDSVVCTGINVKEPMAGCWVHKGHGTVDFYSATAGSCNIYYQTMAARIGEDILLETGRKYGFGQKTGIDLPGEVAGLLPTPEWKAENYTGTDREWKLYDTYYTSIGQGATVDTVMQLASYTATIANDGVRMKPYLVDEIIDDKGTVLMATEPTIAEDMEFTDEISDNLVQAMKDVASGEAGGTASQLFSGLPNELRPAAKTGTAQTGLAADNNDNDFHGVFIAFAPADDPEVAFAGLVEYGTSGGSSAGKVCDAAFEAYFGYQVDYDIILSDRIEE